MAKKENKQQRTGRREQRRIEAEQAKKRRNIMIAMITIPIVAIIAYAVIQRLIPIEGVQTYGSQVRDHIDIQIPRESLPPVGGAHQPSWQNCGVYLEPVANEFAIHSIEHGAVWIAYQPTLPAATVTQLREFAKTSSLILLAPYPELKSPIVATAWSAQLELESADDPRLEQFLRRYEGQGPEAASCRGGIGNPVD